MGRFGVILRGQREAQQIGTLAVFGFQRCPLAPLDHWQHLSTSGGNKWLTLWHDEAHDHQAVVVELLAIQLANDSSPPKRIHVLP